LRSEADIPQHLVSLLFIAVSRVDAEYGDAGLNQLAEHLHAATGGSNSGDDFGAGTGHGEAGARGWDSGIGRGNACTILPGGKVAALPFPPLRLNHVQAIDNGPYSAAIQWQ